MSDNFNMYDQANQQGNPNIPPMPPMEEKKGMSIASMVLGIIGLVFWCIPILGGPIGIVGLILGIVGRKNGGKGMATRWYCYVNYYHRTCSYQCYCWCLSANIKCLEPVIIT